MTTYPMKLTCTKGGATDEGTLHIEDSKPLTDEQIGDIAALFYPRWQGHEGFARAIEAAHGIHAATQLKGDA